MQPKSALQLPFGVGTSSAGALGVKATSSDGQRWDSWGRLTQALFSTVPHLVTPGACSPARAAGRSLMVCLL